MLFLLVRLGFCRLDLFASFSIKGKRRRLEEAGA
jgi:hypothetical protein